MNFSTVPPWLLDHLPRDREVARHQRPDILGIERLAEPGRADSVGEQDGDEPPLLGHGRIVRGSLIVPGVVIVAPHAGRTLDA